MFYGNQTRTYPAIDRFTAKVDRRGPDECWLWKGSVTKHGYGQFKFSSTKMISAHRSSYLLNVGPIPGGAHVCHKCDVPLCVNPSHLFIGDQDINHLDKKLKHRARNQNWRPDFSVCIRGHSDSWSVTPNGTRYCKQCSAERAASRKRRLHQAPPLDS